MEKIKVNELFSGIGAFRKALDKLEIPYEIVGISEIDKFAIKSYEAIFGPTRNYGDISKIDALDYADLWTWGFPCTDISVAGEQKGMIQGETRSGLLYEVIRLLRTAVENGTAPKFLIMENVKNLVGKKFGEQFKEVVKVLDSLGYDNYWQVLKASDYGVPQRRERVFMVSIRKDLGKTFSFADPIRLDTSFADLLEDADEVDEKYYLTEGYLEGFESRNIKNKERGVNFIFEPQKRGEQQIAKTITTKAGQRPCDNFVIECEEKKNG